MKALELVEISPFVLGAARLVVRAARLPLEPWREWRSRRSLAGVCEVIPEVLALIGLPSSPGSGADLAVTSTAWSGTGVAVAKVAFGEDVLVVKLPSCQAAPGLQRAAEVMRRLRADPRVGDFARLVPTPLGDGEIDGQAYAVERALPGVDAQIVLRSKPQARETIVRGAAAAIGELHQRTARTITVDAATRASWVDRPGEVVARVSADPRRVEALAAEVGSAWEGRRVVVSWIHGDYWPGNLLVTPGTGAIVGIVDYEWATPDALPQHDLLHLLVYTRMLTEGVELGIVVRALLTGARWNPGEQRVIDDASASGEADFVMDRSMLLLFWLQHVSLSLLQSPHYARNRIWMARNVQHVLACPATHRRQGHRSP